MRNDATTASRFSFALTTVEADALNWDFAVQVYRAASGDTLYTIQKRFDRGSFNGTTTTDATGDINAPITTAGAVKTTVNFLIRVTDAGAESGANYHSRVQVSMDGGSSWIYDTKTDSALPNGFRFDGAGRYIDFDVAGNLSDSVYYDNFSIALAPVSATLISPQANTPNLGASPILTAAVSNRAPENVTVTFYGREADTTYLGRDFAIAVLPDTQNYARESSGNGDAVKEMWFAQTDWIVANRVSQQHRLRGASGGHRAERRHQERQSEYHGMAQRDQRDVSPGESDQDPAARRHTLRHGGRQPRPGTDWRPGRDDNALQQVFWDLALSETRPITAGITGITTTTTLICSASAGWISSCFYFEYGRYGSASAGLGQRRAGHQPELGASSR